jgi:hypothetical protein
VKKIPPGGTVFVADGTYRQCFEIARGGTADKRIHISARNSGGAVIARDASNATCAATTDAVRWTASFVTLSGFEVTGAAEGGYGIRMSDGAAFNEIVDVAAHNNDTGILVAPTAGPATITDLRVFDNAREGLVIGAENTVAVGVQSLRNQGSGILLQGRGDQLRDSVSYSNGLAGVSVGGTGVTLNSVLTHSNGIHGVALNVGADGTVVNGLSSHHNGMAGLALASSYNTVMNLVSENNGGDGLTIEGSFNRISSGRVSYNTRGVRVIDDVRPFESPTGNEILNMEIDHSMSYDGLKLDRVGYDPATGDPDLTHGPKTTTIENCHIHHNFFNGIYEHVSASGTVIRGCEIDNNGRNLGFAHGVYLGGSEGLLEKNNLHHNSNYGVQLWPSPRGSADRHYLVERNEVFANGSITDSGQRKGGGIVMGGGSLGAPPMYPQWPQYVEVRYNVVHHNVGVGVAYIVGPCGGAAGCDTGDVGNLIHHNTVYGNGNEQLILICANGNKLRVMDNILVGSAPATAGSGLVLVGTARTNLAADSLDGNLYSHGTGGSGSSLFDWNGLLYSFDALKSSGARQNPDCGATGSSDPVRRMDSRSLWSDGIRFVDPGTSLWTTAGGDRHGNFHLRAGSAGIAGGVCSAETNGGQDIDDEDIPPMCALPSFGMGADYYQDADADGVADRFDCAPSSALDASVCDDDPVPDWEEAVCVARGYAGAPYDPAVSPGAAEICDGKDDNCDGALLPGGEADADHDGFFTCGGDCDDNDSRVFPDAQEFCDGKDNDCNGVIDEGAQPGEATGLLFSNTGTLTWVAPAEAISHALYRGTVDGGAWTFNHACLQTGLLTASATDNATPARGTGFYYLASGMTACGEEGLGSTSSGASRPNPAPCP